MYVRNTATFFLVVTITATAFVRARAEVPSWAKVSPEQVAAAKKLGVPVAFENSVGMRFVLIPPGTFMMGSKESTAEVAAGCNMPNALAGWFYDEHPRHEVTLTAAFYMAIHETTQGCYCEAVPNPQPKEADKKLDEFKRANHPVNVWWESADKFCKALSSLEAEKSRKYFLPTEAQWEYACRAGTETPFSFGETISTGQANYHGDYTYGEGSKGENRGKPLPVGSLAANAWGLYDMHGNVSEWCADWYGRYGSAAESDPKGPGGNLRQQRILRGGSWRSYPGACRSGWRQANFWRNVSFGFRVCCAVPTKSDDVK